MEYSHHTTVWRDETMEYSHQSTVWSDETMEYSHHTTVWRGETMEYSRHTTVYSHETTVWRDATTGFCRASAGLRGQTTVYRIKPQFGRSFHGLTARKVHLDTGLSGAAVPAVFTGVSPVNWENECGARRPGRQAGRLPHYGIGSLPLLIQEQCQDAPLRQRQFTKMDLRRGPLE